MMKALAALFIAAALLGGCASPALESRGGPSDTAVLLAPDLRLDLPEPGAMGRSIEAVQMVTAHHDGNNITFEAHLSITPERVLLVGVDVTGQRLMTVTWRGRQIEVQAAPALPKDVRPGAVLADLLVLYWPEAVVRQALQKSGAELSTDAASRTVSLHGKPVLQASYHQGSADPWHGGLHYRNFAWGYDIDVDTIQVTP